MTKWLVTITKTFEVEGPAPDDYDVEDMESVDDYDTREVVVEQVGQA